MHSQKSHDVIRYRKMTVRELIANLIMMPPEAKVYVDCSTDYPECCEISTCKQWSEIDKNHHNYGWSTPDDEDVFLT